MKQKQAAASQQATNSYFPSQINGISPFQPDSPERTTCPGKHGVNEKEQASKISQHLLNYH